MTARSRARVSTVGDVWPSVDVTFQTIRERSLVEPVARARLAQKLAGMPRHPYTISGVNP